MTNPERMYREAKRTLNPWVGCSFDCKYCFSSFRRQAKRRKKFCLNCYNFVPHPHMERLQRSPPRTSPGEFVFLVDMGDPSFMPPELFEDMLIYCEEHPETDFLIQSKNPSYFLRFTDIEYPNNVILGTTIETNRDEICREISRAPPPSERIKAMNLLRQRKIITVEPILEFDLPVLSGWILGLRPRLWRVYVGYDSHPDKNKLPEPSLAEADALVSVLKSAGIDVRWKLRREAWWKEGGERDGRICV